MQTPVGVRLVGKDWMGRARGSTATLEEMFRGNNSMEDIKRDSIQASGEY